jgi:probable F420-dependent oxidoreductase
VRRRRTIRSSPCCSRLNTRAYRAGHGHRRRLRPQPHDDGRLANDLQTYSKGRFLLGLGSQIKPHITKRYSMPWSHPAARMREFIEAMRAIWSAWHDGTKLAFRGDFYTHTLMTPFFNAGPSPYGAPPVFLAAVGELMTEVAGEVADGLLAHGFTTERYMREITLPALERGLAKSGRTREGFAISYPAMIVTGSNDAEMSAAVQGVKAQLAFYGSTPAYRPVLALHGWGDLHSELNVLSKRGEWVTMADLITDDIVDAFAVVGAPGRDSGQAPRTLRRHGHPHQLLRPVPDGPRAGPGDAGRIPGLRVGRARTSGRC